MSLSKSQNRCDDFEPLVSAMIDGELSPDEANSVRAHIAECASCRFLSTDFVEISKVVKSFSDGPQGSSDENVHETFVVTRRRNTVRNWFSVWRLAPLAGVAALLVTLLVVTVQPPPSATADQLSADQFVRPLSELNKINHQQQRDQELMLRTLGLDLRSLKLELGQLKNASPEEREAMEQQIESMLQRVQEFAVETE